MMHALLALLSVALSGEEVRPAPHALSASPSQIEARPIEGGAAATGPLISYEIRYVTLVGVDWRGKFDPQLVPLARQGGTAVWASDPATLSEWLKYCQGDVRSNVVQAPKVTTPAGGEVSLAHGEYVQYVAHLERIADGPVNRATKLAFKPEVGRVHNGIRTRLSFGRIEDQGLRARFLIESDRILSFQTSQYTEMVTPADENKGESKGFLAAGVNRLASPRAASLNATIQVPVVDSARVDGEWLIPKDGALIVSLGSTTTQKGKVLKEVRSEELVVIRYHPEPDSSPTPVSSEQVASPRPSRRHVPAAN